MKVWDKTSQTKVVLCDISFKMTYSRMRSQDLFIYLFNGQGNAGNHMRKKSLMERRSCRDSVTVFVEFLKVAGRERERDVQRRTERIELGT